MKVVHLDGKEISKKVSITVKIKRYKQMIFRVKLAILLLKIISSIGWFSFGEVIIVGDK